MIWTAIGAIATAVAVIVALYVNYRTNRLQILLLRQQRAQKKLDEMVQDVMQLSRRMRPVDILYYSSKLTRNTFTEEDRRLLERLAVDDESKATNISIKMIILKNHASAKPVLDCLIELRKIYNLWVRSVVTLAQYTSKHSGFAPLLHGEEVKLHRIVNEMMDISIEYNPTFRADIEAKLRGEKETCKRALALMPLFKDAIAERIQLQNDVLGAELMKFVAKEQKRIADIVI